MSTDTAHDYAKRIADELAALAIAEDEMANEPPEEWCPNTRSVADDLGYDPDTDDTPDIGMAWLEDQLDVWAVMEWRHDHTTVTEVRALRTAGGPHCEVIYGGDDELHVRVWWGGEESTQHVECSPVANAMAIVWDNAEQVARS